MNMADRIQYLRKSKGISQEELADKVGVSRQAVSKWESEQSTPDLEKIIIMSDFFGVTTDYILKGIEPCLLYTSIDRSDFLQLVDHPVYGCCSDAWIDPRCAVIDFFATGTVFFQYNIQKHQSLLGDPASTGF